jgi:hypothetical protein
MCDSCICGEEIAQMRQLNRYNGCTDGEDNFNCDGCINREESCKDITIAWTEMSYTYYCCTEGKESFRDETVALAERRVSM